MPRACALETPPAKASADAGCPLPAFPPFPPADVLPVGEVSQGNTQQASKSLALETIVWADWNLNQSDNFLGDMCLI